MSKSLIIVESPTKARTIESFLDKKYIVTASMGHVRDLPKKSFGIDIKDGVFMPKYVSIKENKSSIEKIKKLSKASQEIYIATDEDREGEAIGFHIVKSIKREPTGIKRIVFHEITKEALKEALKNPKTIDIEKVKAQQTRRLLDRIVGYKLSPLLSSKIQRGLSAGRVQSSALKVIVDREKERLAFKIQEYWNIQAVFLESIYADLVKFNSKDIQKLSIKNIKEANSIIKVASEEIFDIEDIKKREIKKSPNPPFITSTLQQSASTNLNFSPKKTMVISQILYEGVSTPDGKSGVITYMRTDSFNVSKPFLAKTRALIKKMWGDKYIPKKMNIYKAKSKLAQEAHEAIRPTNLNFTPSVAKKYLKKDELSLYSLIYNRFLASQMSNAIFESQYIIFSSKSTKFRASGRRLIFDGFYKIIKLKSEDKILPLVENKTGLRPSKFEKKQHFTEPPPRYSEASLIKKLESLGIGRPSTYASIIGTLNNRNYTSVEKRQILPTKMAMNVVSVLEKHFSNIVNPSFTSDMEDLLDDISIAKKDDQDVLESFWKGFIKQIEDGKKNIKTQKIAIPTGEKCPRCSGDLVKKRGRFGEFIACSNFPKCKFSKNITGKTKEPPEQIGVVCPECSGDIVKRKSKRGEFYGCSNFPKCKFISALKPSKKKCDKCGYITVMKKIENKYVYSCLKCKKEMKEIIVSN